MPFPEQGSVHVPAQFWFRGMLSKDVRSALWGWFTCLFSKIVEGNTYPAVANVAIVFSWYDPAVKTRQVARDAGASNHMTPYLFLLSWVGRRFSSLRAGSAVQIRRLSSGKGSCLTKFVSSNRLRQS